MAGRAPSRQELIRRRRQSGFVGRQGELASFREAMQQPPDEVAQFLFHIRGPAGVGKSTLVRQLESAVREAQGITAYVDESVADVVEAMRAVSTQLAQQGAVLKGFDKLLAAYRQRRHEADADIASIGGGRGPDRAGGEKPGSASPATVVASRIGLAGLGMVPGVGAFTGALDPNQVAAAAEQAKAVVSARLRSHEDVELVLSPLQVLTPVFLQDLAEVAQRRRWVVLFFDTYERTGPLLEPWLRDVLVSDRYGELPANVLVVLAGQRQLDPQYWGDWLDVVADLPLEVFTESEARQLLAAKGVTGERVIEVILQLSGRLPLLVSTLAEARPADVDEVGDPSGTAVERFLKWETDPARRGAALACALPQDLDEDVYRAAVEDEEAQELFGWLRSMPFVTDRAGRCRYHDVVRTAMLRLQRRQSPTRWQEQHTRLADAFQQWRTRLETGAGESWKSERWRGHRLRETYHRLCAAPQTALPPALRELLDVHDHDPAELRRWVQTLAQAGHDADAADVLGWGERLLAALDEPQPGVAVLTLLLARGGFDPLSKALAYALRGWEHGLAKRHEQAIADYTAALALDPESAMALRGRGRVYYLVDRDEEAFADLDRATELDPGNAQPFTIRGNLWYLRERYEEALSEIDHAIRLEPDDPWAVASRGDILRRLKRYPEALVDLDRAIEIDPKSAWALASRGETYYAMKLYAEALADFDRAIELDPDRAWAHANRGRTFQAAGRPGEALADFERAVELDPEYSWLFAERVLAYQRAGQYQEAVADLDRLIELDPEDLLTLGIRGVMFAELGRSEPALADFDRVIDQDPDVDLVLARAHLRRSVGRLVEALTDYDRVLGAEPERVEAIAGRGVVLHLLGRYEEALADLDRAIGIDPEYAWPHYERAVVLHALQHPDRDRELARTVEIITARPVGEESYSISDRGNLLLVHCAMPRWDEAERYLDAFLHADPTPGRTIELMAALRNLVGVIPSAGAHVEPFIRRLESALAG